MLGQLLLQSPGTTWKPLCELCSNTQKYWQAKGRGDINEQDFHRKKCE